MAEPEVPREVPREAREEEDLQSRIERMVRESTKKLGLPERLEDVYVALKIAAILREHKAAKERGDEDDGGVSERRRPYPRR